MKTPIPPNSLALLRPTWLIPLLAPAVLLLAPAVLVACNKSASDTTDAATSGKDGATGGDEVGGGGGDGTISAIKLTNTTVSGLVKDGASGKPLANIVIATDPATESFQTSQQGQYVLNAGRSFGLLTIRGTNADYTQAFPTCVNLKPGTNNLGDIAMARNTIGGIAKDCFPPCSGATTCLNGTCISKCNPLCNCSERCTDAGTCEPDPNAPPAGICGVNSHPLGGSVCECDLGFVPSGDGETCSLPSELTQCPEGAERDEATGVCKCKTGLIPSVTGDKCLPADEALTVTAVADGKVRKEWATPGPAPRGIAFDGASLWVGDVATRKLYQTSIQNGEVASEFDLGEAGSYLVDLASAGGQMFLVLSGTPQAPTTPIVQRVDLASKGVETLSPSEYTSPFGLSFDGFNLISLEGLKIRRREPQNLFIVNPTDVFLDPRFASAKYAITPPSTLRYLAYTTGQYLSWVGTDYDGGGLRTELIALNAVNQSQTPEIGRLSLYIGAAQIVGIEATGTTLWLAGAGQGNAVLPDGLNPPKIVEVSLD
jgi:hypothetical protein